MNRVQHLLQARRPVGSPRKPRSDPAAPRARACCVTVAAAPPRLLDLDATPAYLGVTPWTVRDLKAARSLRRVRIPLPHGGELRKVLFDR